MALVQRDSGIETFDALDDATGELLTVKRMALGNAGLSPAATPLVHEFRVLSCLAHPSIPRVRGFVSDDGDYQYLCLEGNSGFEPVEFWGARNLDGEGFAAWLDGLLQVASYIHSLGLVHRGLTPRSVLVSHKKTDASTRVRVTGFHRSEWGTDAWSHPMTGQLLSEPGALSSAPRAFGLDVGGIGALCAHVLSGGQYDLGARADRSVAVLRSADALLPKPVVRVLHRLLTSDESLRPTTIDELRRELSAASPTSFTAPELVMTSPDDSGVVPRADIARQIDAAANASVAQLGHVLTLVGARGAGKSFISRLAQVEAGARGFQFLECVSSSPGGGPAHLTGAFSNLHQQLLEGSGCVSPRVVVDTVSAATGVPLGCDGTTSRAVRGPRFLCFADDVDRLAPDDAGQLLELLRLARGRSIPVLLVATCREVPVQLFRGAAACLPGEAARGDGSGGISLDLQSIGGLSPRETALLVAATTRVAPDSRFVAWLLRRTNGTPLFVRELTAFLAAQGCLSATQDGLALDEVRTSQIGVPTSVATLVQERLGDLSEEELLVAQAVSLGPGIDPQVIAELTDLESDALHTLIRNLRASGLLRAGSTGEDLSFCHELMNEAVYQRISPVDRRRMHGAVAQAWSQSERVTLRAGRRAEVLAWHLHRSDHPNGALRYALQALTSLAERGRVADSRPYLQIVEDLAADCAEERPAAVSALQQVASAYHRVGRASLCASAARLGVGLARKCDSVSADVRMELLWDLGWASGLVGDPQGALSAFDEAAESALAANNRSWLARANAGRCMAHHMRGEFAEASRLADASLALLGDSAEPQARSTVYNAKGNALLALCDWKGAKLWYTRALDEAAATGESNRLSIYSSNLGLAHLNLGEWGDAERCFEDSLSRARQIGCAYSSELALSGSGMLAMRRGLLEEAAGRLREAALHSRECGDDWGLALTLSSLGELEHARGNEGTAQALFSRADEILLKTCCVDDLPEALRLRSRTLIAQGRLVEADALLSRARETADRTQNRLESANCAAATAELRLHEQKECEAVAVSQEALRSLVAIGATYEIGSTLLTLSRALARSGDAAQAAEHLKEAQAIFQSLGARRDARIVQEELAALAGRAQPAVEELPGERERLSALYKSSRSLAAAESVDALLQDLADIAAAHVPAEVVAAVIMGPDGQPTSVPSALCNLPEDPSRIGSLCSLLLASADSKASEVLIFDARTSSSSTAPVLRARGIRRLLLAPMVSGARRVGAIYLDYRERDGNFSDEDVRFVGALAAQAAAAIENAQLRAKLEDEVEYLRWEVDGRSSFANIIGRSLEMQRLFSLLQMVSRSAVTVLVEGESGTGKELVARAIHFSGPRKKGRFIAQNCAALPEQLLESELFGHVRGAFTGALRDKPGLFEAANGGTFFLDEIADMPPSLQVKLLRVLQDGEVRRVGATDPIVVDVRIIAATNKSLDAEVKAGRFREDLYYRLNVVRVLMPPLRDRRDDIPLLAQHFLDKFSHARAHAPTGFSDQAMELLMNYDWPGNVRELENEIHRAVTLAKSAAGITASALSDRIRSVQVVVRPPRPGTQLSLKDMVEDVEKRVILQVLEENGWNKSRTAEALGLSRQGLLKKIARFGLSPAEE